VQALGHHVTELGGQPADGVGQHRLLLDQQRAGCVQSQDPLLRHSLDRHELDVGPRGGFADRRGVGGIVLLALLDEGFDRFGGNQLHRVTKATENARPVMRGATGLHHHRAAFLLLEECDQLAPAHLALELCLSGLVDAVDLEDGLGGIQANHGNAHGGRLPCCRFQRPTVWHIDAVGAVHPICLSGISLCNPHLIYHH
jgi:hypothetical protein